MSWQLVSMIVLLFALGAGMLWYERSRPPSQIVALVAVLAALAVAGRIVLAPIPNVVATTDIVIIAGFVLGPAPGFAVGALSGLVSNFWLGQGVWTPWQMVAWGMCGVAGGLLWKLTGGRINRWWLAAFCAAAGLTFGAWMNLQTMVSFGGDISLDRYLALEVRAIPFDIAHMTGNAVFALVAGPAMIAALIRFRERFEWRQTEGGLAGLRRGAGVTMIVLGALLFATAGHSPERAEAAYTAQAKKAATWLKGQQNSDGGFGRSAGLDSAITFTARAMYALASVGINPLDVKTNATPYSYLLNNRTQVNDPGSIAHTILALKTVGKNPKDFKGRNLVKALRNWRGNGSFGGKVNTTAWAVLAFRSAGAYKDAQYSLKWLRSVQNDKGNDKGGWGIGKDAPSDPDSTGAVLMAMPDSDAGRDAIPYLRRTQKDSGGFFNSSLVNSLSTGLAVQGLVSQNRGMNYLKKNGNTAPDFLLARQQDNGSIFYAKEDNRDLVWITADVTPALAGKRLPISAPPREEKEKEDPGESNPGGTGNTGTGTSTPGTTLPPGSLAEPADTPPATGNNNGAGNANPGTGSFDDLDDGPDLTPADPEPGDVSVPLIPEAPSAEVLAASEAGPQPSALLATLIGLGVSGGLCGGTILLARRFRW